MTVRTDTAVSRSIVVKAKPDHAFRVFTDGIATWWPPEHHLIEGELAGMGIEQRVGGRVYDVNTAGEECTWGRVIAWDPPSTFAFHWLIGPDWGVPHPDAPASRVTVTFTPVAGGSTKIELVHDELDRHGEGWEKVRDAVGGPNGWGMTLGLFAKVANESD
jgi:uncharacterized protein YndB with AHSA1/START domain